MPRYPDDIIERVREATDLVELVSAHVRLTPRGKDNYFGLCPFHQEKTPSFSVNAALQIYHCFGCGAGGNAFRFVQEIDHISFVEAVQYLAERAGIALPAAGTSTPPTDLHDQLYRANEIARKYFQHILHRDARGSAAASYLRERGLAAATIADFGLGYAPPGWDNLLQVAARRNLSAEVLVRAGLALSRPNQEGHYDRFRDRVTFPIANASGRTIAFGARALRPDDQPKYLNSSESPIYRKGSVLYGLHQARTAIRQAGVAVVVEGYMDVLSLVQVGLANVVACSGTALTMEQCRLLTREAPRVVLLFDGDAAGSAAALRGIELLVTAGLDARVATLPAAHDPDSMVRAEGAEAVRELLAQAPTALRFLLDRVAGDHDLTTVAGRERAVAAAQPLLVGTADPVRRDLLLREVAQRLGVDEAALRQEVSLAVQRQRPPRQRPAASAPAPRRRPVPGPEKAFLGLLLACPRLIGPTATHLAPDALDDPGCQQLLALLFSEYRTAAAVDLPLLMNRLEDPGLVRLLSECAAQGFDDAQIDRQWQDHLLHFRVRQVRRAMDEARQALQEAEARGDQAAAASANRALAELNRQRLALLAEQGS